MKLKTYITLFFIITVYQLPAQELTTLRVGTSYQNTIGLEIGISRIYITDKGFLGGAAGFYGSAELNFHNSHQPLYGLKIGGETTLGLFYGAFEMKYITNDESGIPVLTPKAGLSVFNLLTITYGYNFKDASTFSYISPHQLSLTANISKKAIGIFR